MQEIRCPHCGQVFQVDEAGYAAIVKQVRDSEFIKELHQRSQLMENEKNSAVKMSVLETEKMYQSKLTDKDNEIARLKAIIDNNDVTRKLQINEIEKDYSLRLADKDREISTLSGKMESAEKENLLQQQAIKEKYEFQLKSKEEEVAYYKDLKARQSTKMVGESLERHCEIEFNKLRATGFKNAYFEKDNEVKYGSKGDYIFRDYAEDGTEIISIMFEMKNEMSETATKHKNEDFFKELDKDRKAKNCEYAVLVSLLEADNDLYNGGIVDVSYRYDKMYVIRPQFFIPIITLLRNAALNSVSYKQELALVKSQNIDISNFENEMNDFKKKFSDSYRLAGQRFSDAIDEIDKTIQHLQKVRDSLVLSDKHLANANRKVEDLSIKRLTRNNPTMARKFAELHKDDEGGED